MKLRKSMQRMLRAIVIVISIAFLNSLPAFSERPLRVGIALPLTGVGASYGEAYRKGVELGIESAKERIALHFDDHRYDNATALSALRKFASSDRQDVIVVWGYGPSDAVAPVASSLEQPVFLGSVNPVGASGTNIVNMSSPIEKTLSPLVAYVADRKFKKLFVAAAQIGSLEQSAQVLQAAFPTQVEAESLLPTQNDFRSLISKLRVSSADAVGLFLTPEQIRGFIQQMRDLDVRLPIIGIDTFNDASVYKLFENDSQGPVFLDARVDRSFARDYTARFGTTAHLSEVARGQLHGTLLAFIEERSRSEFSRVSIIEAFKAFPAGKGASGAYRVVEDSKFGPYLHVDQELYQIRNGLAELFAVPGHEKRAPGGTQNSVDNPSLRWDGVWNVSLETQIDGTEQPIHSFSRCLTSNSIRKVAGLQKYEILATFAKHHPYGEDAAYEIETDRSKGVTGGAKLTKQGNLVLMETSTSLEGRCTYRAEFTDAAISSETICLKDNNSKRRTRMTGTKTSDCDARD